VSRARSVGERWDDYLDDLLRDRPKGHGPETDEDRYYDHNTYDPDDPPPYLDLSNDREAEL
jgi:hypothetical protein